MTTLGVSIIDFFENLARWASRNPTKFIAVMLIWLAAFCTMLYVLAS